VKWVLLDTFGYFEFGSHFLVSKRPLQPCTLFFCLPSAPHTLSHFDPVTACGMVAFGRLPFIMCWSDEGRVVPGRSINTANGAPSRFARGMRFRTKGHNG